MGFPRLVALPVLALPRAQAESAPVRWWVQPWVAWRRRAALPCARRVAASEWLARWAQRAALPRMEARAAACGPAALRLAAWCVPAVSQARGSALVHAQAEPRSVASARAALLPEAALDESEQQTEVAVLAVPAQRPEVVSAVSERQPAVLAAQVR
jgi:hypothetical protein